MCRQGTSLTPNSMLLPRKENERNKKPDRSRDIHAHMSVFGSKPCERHTSATRTLGDKR